MSLKRFQHYFFVLPGILVALSIGAIALWGFNPGIDLAGGSLLQVRYEEERPEIGALTEAIESHELGEVIVQPTEETGYILRLRTLSQPEKETLDTTLGTFGEFEEVQYNSVGPSLSAELLQKAWWAIGLVVISTVLFIAFAFRGVSRPVSSFKYGFVAIITLVHDILIPAGLFAYMGHAYGTEVGALFIVALLTILGISINDTIVIFDRIRENLLKNEEAQRVEPYVDVVWQSITQTMARSVNTSLTVIVMLTTLLILGPDSTRELAIALTVGMVAGTYSSIFLAAPLLVLIEKYQKPPKPKEETVVQRV